MMWALIIILAALAAGEPTTTTAPAEAALDPWPEAMRWIYFPPQAFDPNGIARIEGPGWMVYTDSAELDAEQVARNLQGATDALLAIQAIATTAPATQSTEDAAEPAPIVSAVYARQGDFVALWRRVGIYYGGRFLGLARAGGYSYRVVCASYGDADAPGLVPAELTHEFAHVWLWRYLGLANDGNWLAEGLASAIEMRVHPPEPGQWADWAERARAGRYVPLRRLLATRPARTDTYWQLGTLTGMLLEQRPDALPALLDAANRHADPAEVLGEILDTNGSELASRWTQWLAEQARSRDPSAEESSPQDD